MKFLAIFSTVFVLSSAVFAAELTSSTQAPASIESSKAGNVQIGSPAPAFKMLDINNVTVDLNELKGKIIVLEWFNKDCPFSRKHYDSKNMQNLQAHAKQQDIVWITVTSSAEGKQGYLTSEQAKEVYKNESMESAYFILDPTGELGRKYGAKTTPDMFVINKAGNLAYMGAIDNRPSADKKDIEGALNYVKSAMNALYHDAELKTQVTQPYGCSVKY